MPHFRLRQLEHSKAQGCFVIRVVPHLTQADHVAIRHLKYQGRFDFRVEPLVIGVLHLSVHLAMQFARCYQSVDRPEAANCLDQGRGFRLYRPNQLGVPRLLGKPVRLDHIPAVAPGPVDPRLIPAYRALHDQLNPVG